VRRPIRDSSSVGTDELQDLDVAGGILEHELDQEGQKGRRKGVTKLASHQPKVFRVTAFEFYEPPRFFEQYRVHARSQGWHDRLDLRPLDPGFDQVRHLGDDAAVAFCVFDDEPAEIADTFVVRRFDDTAI
jgi:hypothetical protein